MLINIHQVKELTGLSKAHIYKMIRRGQFPDRVRVGAKKVSWRRDEVVASINSRPVVK